MKMIFSIDRKEGMSSIGIVTREEGNCSNV